MVGNMTVRIAKKYSRAPKVGKSGAEASFARGLGNVVKKFVDTKNPR
jgi:hypothetical protein